MTSKARDDLRPKDKEIPDILVDPSSRRRYAKGRFLGKGGFAKCYELTDLDTNEVYAGKIVSKGLLVKQHQKEKMSQEIAIHRSLNHRHIVGFCSFFEDADNVYIVLELCRRRSLMELHKRRKAISEPEARYFLRHILLACKYLHENKVIHRDLKLGNLFLNDEMEVKIGDFGLATKVDFDGERKRTLCGTPNYIAPEVLSKKGHSYEVDVWSLGCILYTLLVGKPPFETTSLKDTYSRIKKNDYQVPPRVTPVAKHLIQRLLQAEPMKRPSMDAILNDEFITNGFLPSRLPTSCLTMAPRFDHKNDVSLLMSRKPLLEINSKDSKKAGTPTKLSTVPEGAILSNDLKAEEVAKGLAMKLDDEPDDCYLAELATQLNRVLISKPAETHPTVVEEEIEDPAAMPMLWVSKWVDYSDKYGLGYQLCDNSVGVVFNDSTKLILQADGENIHYIERNGMEHYHTLKQFPDALNKKVTLLRYFRNYMNEHLLKAGASMTPRDGDDLSRLPCLRTWFRTRSAIVLHLSNGTLQINFFQDHTKIILCPLMSAVTYINEKRESHTYRFGLIEKFGCCRELASRMRYAKTMVDRLLAAKPSCPKPKTAMT